MSEERGERRAGRPLRKLVIYNYDCCSSHFCGFNLVSNVAGVISCDMSSVPLPDESVDVVVFCLSLMGTNIKVRLFPIPFFS